MKQIILAIILAFSVTSYVHAAELSEDQIEEIAEQYIEACLSQNYAAWKSLFLNIGDVSEADFTKWKIRIVKRIRIKEVDGYNVRLQIQYKSGSRVDGWLQLLPDGKIKYGALVYEHPIPVAFEALHPLYMVYRDEYPNIDIYGPSERLIKSGVPLFGYSQDGRIPPHKKLKQLESIKEWLLENGEEWDQSEPKLVCPEDQFKALLRKYK